MPELPEVEVVRRGLTGITGRTIRAVAVLHPRPVRRHLPGPDDFAATLAGRTFAEPRRRGKYLWLPLTDGDAVLAHLGMSGQFRMDATDRPLLPNTRVIIDFADGDPQLRFVDQRMFGGLSLSPGGAELPSEVAHIGRDPFDPEFDLAAAVRAMRAKRTGIKRALLDQQLVSGIGNIYADEALWLARMHYAKPTAAMSPVAGPAGARGRHRRDAPPRSARAAPRSTRSTSTSTARAGTSTDRSTPTARRASPAPAAARRSCARPS